MKYALPVLFAAFALPVVAESTRQLDSHEHGVGELNIAVDGTTVAMEFHAPGADIVGFEYEAKSDADRAAIDAALAKLGKPLELFAFADGAGCAVVKASAALEEEDGHDGHEDHDDHKDDHDHEGHKAEDHDDHDEHDKEAGHTEFHAEYELTCSSLSAGASMTFPYFAAFENARELEVQVVTGSGAQAFEVERDAPTLDLSGLF